MKARRETRRSFPIVYTGRANEAGYVWRQTRLPRPREVLAMVENPIRTTARGFVVTNTAGVQAPKSGLRFAQRAVNAFAALGDRAEVADLAEMREGLLAFACTFGLLKGDGEDAAMTASEWVNEARA